MKYVTIDDPVTFLIVHTATVCDRVETISREGFRTEAGFEFRHDEEDVSWTRGHHLPDTEHAKALKSCAAMDVNRPPPPSPPSFASIGVPAPPLPAAVLPPAEPWLSGHVRREKGS